MYDKEIPDDSVNKAKQTLFTQKGREIEKNSNKGCPTLQICKYAKMQICTRKFALHIVVQMWWISEPWIINNLCKPLRF